MGSRSDLLADGFPAVVEFEAAIQCLFQIGRHLAVDGDGIKSVVAEPDLQLQDNADIKEFYLGLTDVGTRKSYREVKHYKRRKRWLS